MNVDTAALTHHFRRLSLAATVQLQGPEGQPHADDVDAFLAAGRSAQARRRQVSAHAVTRAPAPMSRGRKRSAEPTGADAVARAVRPRSDVAAELTPSAAAAPLAPPSAVNTSSPVPVPTPVSDRVGPLRPLHCNQLGQAQKRQLTRIARDLAHVTSRSDARALLEEAAAALDPLGPEATPRPWRLAPAPVPRTASGTGMTAGPGSPGTHRKVRSAP